ncbi:pheromone-processing carboxypeptidase KEX1 [Scheffersomyces coipomensis]|uniref:pheromone-processing carboxypeptidase KEX1 n=1 Tax=Scheffersomyces coipomensis TaxID=1788519 RepID=UPI00315D57DE
MRFITYYLLVLSQLIFTTLALPPKLGQENDLQKQYLVTTLPGLYDNLKANEIPLMFSGQLELYPETNTHYFFWKFSDVDKIPENNKRTIFWLNGGPGCSSMDGALLEAGPFRIDKDKKVIYNSGSWHKAGDIIFVDQPGGTGFSFTDSYDHELGQISDHFLKFLEKYFEVFPDEIDNEIYFAGESYAGQYIPYIGDGILKYNKLETTEKPYNLKGLLIGNGWISPDEQSLSYIPYAVHAGFIKPSNPHWQELLVQHQLCQKVVDRVDNYNDDKIHQDEISNVDCDRILQFILQYTRDTSGPKNEQCINMYDYTKKDSYPSCGMNWPAELKYVTPFLREEEVMGDLNLINHKQWHECDGRVGGNLNARNSQPAVHLLPGILEQIPIVLFNGNLDIICNYIGTENFIKKLTWNGEKGFSEDVEPINWIYDDETAGYIKTERNLTFVNVFDASHMVPYDKPEISRALLDLITGNYDDTTNKGDKRAFITYPLGVRQAKIADEEAEAQKEAAASSISESIANTASESESDVTETKPTETDDDDEVITTSSSTVEESESSEAEYHSSPSTSRITRLIQLLVILVLIWGVYVLYSSYKSRPSSIIKSGSNSGKKKNVQWADQLRRFQEDDEEAQDHQPQNQGFLTKTFNRLTGVVGGDDRGNYTATKTYEDIELGEGIAMHDNDDQNSEPNLDDFIIDSEDDEAEEQEGQELESAGTSNEQIDSLITHKNDD